MSREEELVVEASLADNGNGVEDVEDVENALREGDALPLLFDGTVEDEPVNMTRSQAYNLYTSHFLSTWNVRTYEFAAVSTSTFLPTYLPTNRFLSGEADFWL